MGELISIIGVDPGTRHPGAAELVSTPTGWEVSDMPKIGSLEELAVWCDSKIVNPPPNLKLVAAEDVANILWYAAVRTSKTTKHHAWKSDALRIIEAVGLARMIATHFSVPFVLVQPNTMKMTITGSESASKQQIQKILSMHVRRWPNVSNLNQSDAAGVALTAYRRQAPGVVRNG